MQNAITEIYGAGLPDREQPAIIRAGSQRIEINCDAIGYFVTKKKLQIAAGQPAHSALHIRAGQTLREYADWLITRIDSTPLFKQFTALVDLIYDFERAVAASVDAAVDRARILQPHTLPTLPALDDPAGWLTDPPRMRAQVNTVLTYINKISIGGQPRAQSQQLLPEFSALMPADALVNVPANAQDAAIWAAIAPAIEYASAVEQYQCAAINALARAYDYLAGVCNALMRG